MLQTKDRSGNKPKTYRFDGSQIEVLPYFLYEVCAYKLWKNGACMLKSRFFKSKTFLHIKNTEEFKTRDGYTIVRSIELLGAPYSFIKERKLPVYKLNNKVQKK